MSPEIFFFSLKIQKKPYIAVLHIETVILHRQHICIATINFEHTSFFCTFPHKLCEEKYWNHVNIFGWYSSIRYWYASMYHWVWFRAVWFEKYERSKEILYLDTCHTLIGMDVVVMPRNKIVWKSSSYFQSIFFIAVINNYNRTCMKWMWLILVISPIDALFLFLLLLLFDDLLWDHYQ